MATKSKKQPATPKKKPATAKKPAPKPKKASASAAPPTPAAHDAAVQVLEAALADVVRLNGALQSLEGELQSARAEREQLRGETLKSVADVAAAGRRADEAGRRADERERERLRVARELEVARAELAGYKLRCPKCGKNFVEEEYEGITIDRCSGCDAVYFDAGEVDQLIAKVHEKTTAPSADPQQTSGWFRGLFKRKPKAEPTGGEPPPAA